MTPEEREAELRRWQILYIAVGLVATLLMGVAFWMAYAISKKDSAERKANSTRAQVIDPNTPHPTRTTR